MTFERPIRPEVTQSGWRDVAIQELTKSRDHVDVGQMSAGISHTPETTVCNSINVTIAS